MVQKKISIHFLKWIEIKPSYLKLIICNGLKSTTTAAMIICNGLKSTAEISAVPMGLYKIFQTAKSQRLGRFIKVRLQSDLTPQKYQPSRRDFLISRASGSVHVIRLDFNLAVIKKSQRLGRSFLNHLICNGCNQNNTCNG
jgi:hypothetical protein